MPSATLVVIAGSRHLLPSSVRTSSTRPSFDFSKQNPTCSFGSCRSAATTSVSKSCAPPLQARGHRRVDLLLDAAAAVVAEVGVEAATTNAIAARAKTSVGSLYQFFPDKDALVWALGQRFIERGILANQQNVWPADPKEMVHLGDGRARRADVGRVRRGEPRVSGRRADDSGQWGDLAARSCCRPRSPVLRIN